MNDPTESAAAEPKVKAEEKPYLDDAGAFLPYARKHMVQDEIKATQDSITLDVIWPEPNWRDLVAKGMPVSVAAAVAMLRDGLSNKPRSGEVYTAVSAEQWRSAYVQAVKLIRYLLLTAKTAEDAFRINDRLASYLKTSVKQIRVDKIENNLLYWAAGRGKRRLYSPGHKTLRQAQFAHWLPKLGWPADDVALKAGIVPVQLTDKTWRAAKIDGDHFILCDDAPIATEEEAISAAIRFAKVVQTGEAIPLRPSQDKRLKRVGPDHRNSENITPERLMKEFGLRAVQFGNTVGQRERQVWMNEAFDALADLADVLNWPRKWLGFNSSRLKALGLAIGARGKGGAEAHFEPDLFVVNLTRGHGAGALAHEWAHGADCRMGQGAGLHLTYLSQRAGQLSPDSLGPKYQRVHSCMHSIMGICKNRNSDYFKQSLKIARVRRAGSYWIAAEEMFARGLEAYIQDALIAKGRTSPWLVMGTLASDYDLSVVASCPYPIGSERWELNRLYEQLLKTLAAPADAFHTPPETRKVKR